MAVQGDYTTQLPRMCVQENMAVQGGYTAQLREAPPGWEMECRLRTGEGIYQGRYDKFYYEPETGKQFRSLKSAWRRYMETKKEIIEAGKNFKPSMIRLVRLRSRSLNFNFSNPLQEVLWIFIDPTKNKWTPFVGGKVVDELEKRRWAQAFLISTRWKKYFLNCQVDIERRGKTNQP